MTDYHADDVCCCRHCCSVLGVWLAIIWTVSVLTVHLLTDQSHTNGSVSRSYVLIDLTDCMLYYYCNMVTRARWH